MQSKRPDRNSFSHANQWSVEPMCTKLDCWCCFLEPALTAETFDVLENGSTFDFCLSIFFLACKKNVFACRTTSKRQLCSFGRWHVPGQADKARGFDYPILLVVRSNKQVRCHIRSCLQERKATAISLCEIMLISSDIFNFYDIVIEAESNGAKAGGQSVQSRLLCHCNHLQPHYPCHESRCISLKTCT